MPYLLICDCEILRETLTLGGAIEYYKSFGNPMRMRIIKVAAEWSINKDFNGKYKRQRCRI